MVNCPVMKRKIEDEVCFDIIMVAERMAPERTVPEDVIKTKNYREICLNCKNHKE